MAFIRFFNYTGLYNTFRLGVLKPILDRHFSRDDPDIKVYIPLYYAYLKAKDQGDTERVE